MPEAQYNTVHGVCRACVVNAYHQIGSNILTVGVNQAGRTASMGSIDSRSLVRAG